MPTRTDKNKIKWTNPANQNPEITIDDFKAMVKESEKSPFLSMTQYKRNRKEWRKKLLKD